MPTYLDHVERRGEETDMTIRWEAGDQTWGQLFTTKNIDGEELDRALQSADLQFDRWLDLKENLVHCTEKNESISTGLHARETGFEFVCHQPAATTAAATTARGTSAPSTAGTSWRCAGRGDRASQGTSQSGGECARRCRIPMPAAVPGRVIMAVPAGWIGRRLFQHIDKPFGPFVFDFESQRIRKVFLE